MSERRVLIEAEDYEALRREALSRGVGVRNLISEAVRILLAADHGVGKTTLGSLKRRQAGAQALLDTELAIDWGGWEELEGEILDARG